MESQWVEILSVVVFLVILSMSTYYLIWPGTDSDGNPRTDVRIVSAIVLGLSFAVLFFFLWSLFGDLNSRVSTMDSRVSTMDSRVSTMDSDMGTMKEDVSNLKSAVKQALSILGYVAEKTGHIGDEYVLSKIADLPQARFNWK